MKIVFVAPRFHTNQVEIVRALVEAGNSVHFHVILIGATEDYSALTPVVFEPGLFSRLLMRWFGEGGVNATRKFPSPWKYWKYLRDLSPDVVIVRAPNRAFSFVAAVCARLQGAKVVFYTQGMLYRPYPFLTRFLIQALLLTFNAAWYTPLLGRQRDSACKPPNWMYYVPFPVARAKAFRRNSADGINILMVSKYQPRKNHALLLAAVAQLVGEFRLSLTMVGECVNEAQFEVLASVRESVAKLGLDGCVTILTNVPYQSMPSLYRKHNLFVHPASRESAAVSVLEALASGMPAVCSDTCGTRSYVSHGQTGCVFKSDDLEDLVRKLKMVVDAPGALERMSENALAAYDDTMSSQAYLAHLSALMSDRWGM